MAGSGRSGGVVKQLRNEKDFTDLKMAKSRPEIMVSGPDRGGLAAWIFIRLAVRRAKGIPVRVTPSRPQDLNDRFNGLILSGGADVDPSRYGKEAMVPPTSGNRDHFQTRTRRWISHILSPILFTLRKLFSRPRSKVDKKRDRLELKLIDQAIRRNIPILGICRGMQLLNISLGGSLHQNLNHFYSEVPRIHSVFPAKRVQIETRSRLHDILGVNECLVNGLHKQGVDLIGDQLRVSAREKSGVVQALEHEKYPFMIGVQWHPEYLPQLREQSKIFESFIKTAANDGEKEAARDNKAFRVRTAG
jgi:putative glutamine amidotransferase